MGFIDDTKRKGGHKSTTFAYLNKDEAHDAILEVVEAKDFPSTNPNSEGDEMFAVVFKVVKDNNDSIPLAPDGTVSVLSNMDKGSKSAKGKRLEEMSILLSVISGTPVEDIYADPTLLRSLTEDTKAFEGVQVRLTSYAQKGDFFNHRFETEDDYQARIAKEASRSAKRQPRVSEESEAPDAEPVVSEQPATTKRPKRGKADESAAL